MVYEVIMKQELIDAKRDVHDLGDSVNEKKIIYPRYGAPYRSIPLVVENIENTINEWQDAINTITVNDGVPALAVSDASGKTQQDINDKIFHENVSIRDFIADPTTTDHTSAFIALNNYFANKDYVEFSLVEGTYNINFSTPNLLDFRGKKSVVIHCGTSAIRDLSTYAAAQTRNFLNVDDCESVYINETLNYKGNRNETVEGDPRGAYVVKAQNVKTLKANISSEGNSAAIYDNLGTYSSNWELNIVSKNDHYPMLVCNVDNLQANIIAINSYRSLFILGCQNSTVNLMSSGQVGSALIKSYDHNPVMKNLNINTTFRNAKPYSNTFAPLRLEIQSDISVSIKDINIYLDVEDNAENPFGSAFTLDNLKKNGSIPTTSAGHVIDGLTLAGRAKMLNSANILELTGGAEFFPGDTVKNVKFKDLELLGAGRFSVRLYASEKIVFDNISIPDGQLSIWNRNAAFDYEVINSSIKQMASDSSGRVSFDKTKIALTTALDKNTFRFKDTVAAEYRINRQSLGATEKVNFTRKGDLTVPFVVAKAMGAVRAQCRMRYFVIKDITLFGQNFESGYIDFSLYVSPSGSTSLTNQVKTVLSKLGQDIVVELTGVQVGANAEIKMTASGLSEVNSSVTCEIEFIFIPIAGSFYAVSSVD